MKVLVDENLSPDLAPVGNGRGYYTTSTRDLDLLGRKDFRLIPYCLEHEYTLATIDDGDPKELIEGAGIHSGLIVFEGEDDTGTAINLERMKAMFDAALTYIEQQASSARGTPASFMTNTVVEVGIDRCCRHYDLP